MSDFIKKVGHAVRDAIMAQRVNADQIATLHGIIPPLDWEKIGGEALKAAREPTSEMASAALEASGNRVSSSPPEYECGALISDGLSEEDAAQINLSLCEAAKEEWKAMIDEALK